MINVPAKQRQRQRLTQIRLMVPMERRFARTLEPTIGRMWSIAANQVVNGNVKGIGAAVRSQSKRFRTLLSNHLRRVAAVFQAQTQRAINRATKASGDEFWTDIDSWVQSHVTTVEKAFTAGQVKTIEAIVLGGIEAGEAHAEIAKKIATKGIRDKKWKALRIARTETHNAAIKSTETQMQQSRLVVSKRWVAALDARTRSDHLAGNMHPLVEQGKLFRIGTDNLEYPGDGSHGAGAHQIVNCRCVLMYETSRKRGRLVRR